MRKLIRRSFVLMLAVLMLMSLAAPAYAATKSNVKQYSDYCCIGDSVCNGYSYVGLDYSNNFSPNDKSKNRAHFGNVADNTWPGVVRDAVGADFHSMICVGQNLVDALWILGDYEEEYTYDEAYGYHYVHQNSHTRWEAMEYMHDTGECIERIRQSGLITIYIGSNDLFTYPKNYSYKSDGFDFEQCIKMMAEGYRRFVTGYPRLIERVNEINPTAKIVVVSLFNPYTNVKFNENDEGYTLGKLIGTYIGNANLHLKAWSAYYGCTYVDISEVGTGFREFDASQENWIQQLGSMDCHPNEKWNYWIADKVLEALPEASSQVSLPKTGVMDFEVNGKDAGSYILRKQLIGWTVRNEQGEYVCYDGNTKQLVFRENNPSKWFFNGGFYTIAMNRVETSGPFKLVNVLYRPAIRYINFEPGGLTASTSKVTITMYKDN